VVRGADVHAHALSLPDAPFSRRTRDARANPAWLEEARKLVGAKTVPVYVEDGRAMSDSTSIVHWIERAHPAGPPLWPSGAEAYAAFEVASLVDVAIVTLADLGSRYWDLHDSASWANVKGELVGRAQRALDVLAQRASSLGRPTFAASGWLAADIWLYTATAWLEGIPARAANKIPANKAVAQIWELGWSLPPALSRWADAHRDRSDVRALDS
jgi:glutathione S-transferase